MNKPSLYFVAGAGGNWVNYVTWCGLHQKTWSYDFIHFHAGEFKQIIPGYDRYYKIVPHNQFKEHKDICLGSTRASLNFYINVRKKNPSWTGGSASGFIDLHKHRFLTYNLDYVDIFCNPEAFLNQLKNLSGYDICFDQHTEKAIEQYRKSCPWANLTFDELAQTPAVQEAYNHCFDNLTDINLAESARREEAWHIVRRHLLVLK